MGGKTYQSHMYALARQLKLDVIQQRTTGDCVMEGLDGSISRFVYGEVPAVSTTIRGS